jgi:hypothetical protein
VLLSDADREVLFEQLSRHAAAGRIELDELERRVAAISVAATREQAAAVMQDLPALAPESSAGAGRGSTRRWKGYGVATAAAPDWQPTAERFREPRSGKVMRVWVDAAGSRHYIEDDAAG